MTLLKIPILPFPDQSFKINLGERTFFLRLTYQTRRESWYLSLFDADEVPIELGARVIQGVALFGRSRDLRLPIGAILALAFGEDVLDGAVFTADAFANNDLRLYFLDPEEVFRGAPEDDAETLTVTPIP